MDVLVVGGSGFIGRSLCRVLDERGHRVTAASRSPSAAELPDGVETTAVDVRRPELTSVVSGHDVVVNLALIAVGITFSPLVEVVAVAFFTVAVAAFALLVLRTVVPTMARTPGVLLTVATLSVVATMALALAYGYSAFPATPQVISVGEMVRWHGTLNAFGFAVPALLAFRLR